MSIRTMSVPVDGGNSPYIMPKLQNRFRVTFNFSNGEAPSSQLITGNVLSVTRPTLSFAEVPIDVYNSKIYIAGKHEWNMVELVIRDDISNGVIVALDNQINRQLDMAQQSAAKSGADYKFSVDIETLDGTNGSIGGDENNFYDKWELQGAFIQNIAYGNNDYSSSDPVTVTVSLRYDNAIHSTKTDDDTQSGAQTSIGNNNNASAGSVGS